MTPIIGNDQQIYCTIECLRQNKGVLADPVRLAAHFEFEDYCSNCGIDLDPSGEVE